MTCPKTKTASPPNQRHLIAVLFSKGRVETAAVHRWGQCAHANECGYACPNLDKEAGMNPQCIGDGGRVVHSADLYADLKRPEFICPDGRF